MDHETRMKLTRQLEQIRQADEGANSRWLYLAGTTAEVVGAAGLLGGAIRLFLGAEHHPGFNWYAVVCILCAVILLGHAIRVVTNRFMNRTLRPLMQAVLELPDA
jgi:hypothetical protein